MSSTGRILERVTYSAYGVATRHPVADFNRDGFTDFFDDLAYDDCFTGSGCPSGQTADLNLDGVADMFDYDEWDLSYAEQVNTARGVLSQNDASAAVNRLGYAGYWFEPSTQQYLVRNREYDPNTGVWDERDPMGYHDGADLYMYVMNSPITRRDPFGLAATSCCGLNGLNSSSLGQPTTSPNFIPGEDVIETDPSLLCGTVQCCYDRCTQHYTDPESRDRCIVRCREHIENPDTQCCQAACRRSGASAISTCCNGTMTTCMCLLLPLSNSRRGTAQLLRCVYDYEACTQSVPGLGPCGPGYTGQAPVALWCPGICAKAACADNLVSCVLNIDCGNSDFCRSYIDTWTRHIVANRDRWYNACFSCNDQVLVGI
jgi:RHS repeat-associated protein